MTTHCYLTIDEDMFKHDKDHPRGDVHGTNFYHMQGSIEVLEWKHEIEQEGIEEGGKPRSVERVKRGEFLIKKACDNRSPKLYYFCCSGEFLNDVALHIYGPTGVAFLSYMMTWVHVSSYKPEGGDTLPTEWIGFKYGEMAVKFNDSGVGGVDHGNLENKQGSITTRWSWVFETPTTAGPGMPEIPV